MTGNPTSRLAFLAASAAVAIALPQSTVPPKAKAAYANEILAALKTGRSVVLVVQPSAKAGSGEAYADWAEYLNEFAAVEKSVTIVKISQPRYAELVTAPKLSRPYNTLFLRDAGNALLYRGMILEPDVYRIGKAYMTAKSGAETVQREGLEEVKLTMRNASAALQNEIRGYATSPIRSYALHQPPSTDLFQPDRLPAPASPHLANEMMPLALH